MYMYELLLLYVLLRNEKKTTKLLRMSQHQFNDILVIMKEDTSKDKTNSRDLSSAKEHLAVCVR